MNRDLTSQRVHQLREEIDELRFMNEIYKYKKGPVADTERVRRHGRLLEIQGELTAMTARKVHDDQPKKLIPGDTQEANV